MDYLNIILKEGFVGCLMMFLNFFLFVFSELSKFMLLFLMFFSFLMVLFFFLVMFVWLFVFLCFLSSGVINSICISK